MKFFKLFFLILTIFLFLSNCTTHSDKIKRNALLTFLAACTGGSTTTCYAACNSSCGVSTTDPVTSTSLLCLNGCQASCSSNCSIFSLYITLNRKQ